MISLTSMLTTLLLAAGPAAGDPDLQQLFEELASADDGAGIDRLFESRSFEVIYLVDGYLTAWLSLVDSEPLPAGRLGQFANHAAACADHVFGGSAYADYARAVSGLDAPGRRAYLDGNEEFEKGREEQRQHRYGAAKEHYEESLRLLEPLGATLGIARAEQALGDLAVGEKRLEDAIRWHTAGRDRFARLRHPAMLRSCRALGFVYEALGDMAAARQNLERMLVAAAAAGRDTDTSAVRAALVRICTVQGDEEAASRYRAAPPEQPEPASGK